MRLLDRRMLVWALVCQVLILLLLFLTVPRTFEKNPVRASVIQACFCSNFITFGMVIVGGLGSSDKLMVVPVLAGVLIPLYNVDSVGILEYYRGGKLEPGRVAKQVGSNPFAISYMISLVLAALKIKLPVCVKTVLGNMASCANPMSFLALGRCLDLVPIGGYKKKTLTGVGYRLVLQPVVPLRLSHPLGSRGTESLALVVMLISPTAVAAHNMTRSMDIDGGPAGHLVVFQSLGLMVTISLQIFLLNGLEVL